MSSATQCFCGSRHLPARFQLLFAATYVPGRHEEFLCQSSCHQLPSERTPGLYPFHIKVCSLHVKRVKGFSVDDFATLLVSVCTRSSTHPVERYNYDDHFDFCKVQSLTSKSSLVLSNVSSAPVLTVYFFERFSISLSI